MLVLTRKLNEVVDITDQHGLLIGTVKVVNIKDSQIRLAFDFPLHIRVDRHEVTLRRQSEGLN